MLYVRSAVSYGVQVEVILTFEEFCGEEGEFSTDQGTAFASIFIQVGGCADLLCDACWTTRLASLPTPL